MRYLSFQIGESFYGVPLEQVREVIAFPNFTPMPNSPEFCLGIMSLRDQIIPIIDLRIKFKVEPTLTHDTSVIICDLQNLAVGVVVDIIHNVVAPADTEVMKAPGGSFAGDGSAASDLISQVVQREGRLSLTLDMARILSSSTTELQMLQSAHQDLKAAA